MKILLIKKAYVCFKKEENEDIDSDYGDDDLDGEIKLNRDTEELNHQFSSSEIDYNLDKDNMEDELGISQESSSLKSRSENNSSFKKSPKKKVTNMPPIERLIRQKKLKQLKKYKKYYSNFK